MRYKGDKLEWKEKLPGSVKGEQCSFTFKPKKKKTILSIVLVKENEGTVATVANGEIIYTTQWCHQKKKREFCN